jgi:hypothetical protein
MAVSVVEASIGILARSRYLLLKEVGKSVSFTRASVTPEKIIKPVEKKL